MSLPDEKVSSSVSKSGDIADEPDDVFDLAVSDRDNKIVGYVEKWDTAEWIYAERAATRWLQHKRFDEYEDSLQSDWEDNEGTGKES